MSNSRKWIAEASAVAGDTIRFTEGVFEGSFRKPKFIGERKIVATVEAESYGAERQQHTFSLIVVLCEGAEPLAPGTKGWNKRTTLIATV